jgi:hypothetical protein
MYKSAIKLNKLNKKTNISSTYIGRNNNDTNGGTTTAIEDLGERGIW